MYPPMSPPQQHGAMRPRSSARGRTERGDMVRLSDNLSSVYRPVSPFIASRQPAAAAAHHDTCTEVNTEKLAELRRVGSGACATTSERTTRAGARACFCAATVVGNGYCTCPPGEERNPSANSTAWERRISGPRDVSVKAGNAFVPVN